MEIITNPFKITPKDFKTICAKAKVPDYIYKDRTKFDLDKLVVDVNVKQFKLKDGKVKPIKTRLPKEYQIESYTKLFKKPIFTPYTYCISSSPHDFDAQKLALNILLSYKVKTRIEPYWLRLYGGFYKAEDMVPEKIGFLVISNVFDNCSDIRVDLLRDVLEVHSNIPKIVVLSSDNGLQFFVDKLRRDVDYYTHINTKLKLKGITKF